MLPLYIYKLIKKKPSKFQVLEACKNQIIWLDNNVKNFYIHHSIFPRRGRSGKWHFFMLSSVLEFGQILPFSSTHFGIFLLISIEICQEIGHHPISSSIFCVEITKGDHKLLGLQQILGWNFPQKFMNGKYFKKYTSKP